MEIDWDFIRAWRYCNGITCYSPITGRPIKRNGAKYKEFCRKYDEERYKTTPYGPCAQCGGVMRTAEGDCATCIGRIKYHIPETNLTFGYHRQWTTGCVNPNTGMPIITGGKTWTRIENENNNQ